MIITNVKHLLLGIFNLHSADGINDQRKKISKIDTTDALGDALLTMLTILTTILKTISTTYWQQSWQNLDKNWQYWQCWHCWQYWQCWWCLMTLMRSSIAISGNSWQNLENITLILNFNMVSREFVKTRPKSAWRAGSWSQDSVQAGKFWDVLNVSLRGSDWLLLLKLGISHQW